MNWKECGRKQLRFNLKYYPNIVWEELRTTTKTSVITLGLQDLPNITVVQFLKTEVVLNNNTNSFIIDTNNYFPKL
jgi:hypothetical protein